MGEIKNSCRILVGKPEGKRPFGRPRPRKRPFGRPRPRWEDDTKINLREAMFDVVDWILQDGYRRWVLVNTVMSLPVP
jgi:hypothetical protein